ncbi:MAG: hypothetical protein HOB84_05535 [Candidatus Marinimicrobia bacterium]|jgi:hypothetical protein|nr:hypothetical protein [Candidatus Neomarinimicrobiota bacterium]MBT4359572.1 hypothetical protein [Candidatus Neomarinimicrobiota bacterium]MBT4714214.1 hypothetical protein [Candidatus Neomarinimicrobiota bacterium]MBT4945530.1 hypothetical protein [Candidatus Neomarinimicrobiota bacterium]MBT5314186.1 hypothetical protein [Candidatus Neomarinimicrobiota bacterium]
MKKLTIIIIALTTLTMLVNCSDDHVKKAESHDTHHKMAGQDDRPSGLVLNDGKKWKMDEHTRISFVKMADSFLNTDHASMETTELKSVGGELQTELNVLVKGCTMTGEAHDQLHVYLAGYMPAVKTLSQNGDMESAKQVKQYLEIYDDYME